MEYPELDLALPRAKLVKTYVDSSHTPVSLLKGFYGNVVFEPWHDFEALLDKAGRKLDAIDWDFKKEVDGDLRKCRKQLGIAQTEGTSAKPSVPSGELESMTSLITSSRSATGEASSLVRRVAHVQRKIEINSDQGEEDFGFTNCTSMSRITEIVFLVLEEIVSKIKNRKLHLKCLNFSVNALESVIPPSPVADLNWKKLEHDFSLSKHFNIFNKKSYRPYATFELKGPARRLYRWKQGYNVQKINTSPQGDGPGGAPPHHCDPVRVDSKRDVKKLEEDSAESLAAFCNAGFRETREEDTDGSSRTEDGEKTSFMRTNAAENLPKLRPPQLYIVPIAQALAQGLISATGCCMLSNHQNAIAFKICGLQPPENKKVRILVSRQFDCEEQKGTLLAMIALMLHSLELYAHKKKRKELREMLSTALKYIYDWTVRRNQKEKKKRPADDSRETEADGKRQRTGESQAAQRHSSSKGIPDDLSETTVCTEHTDATMREDKGTQERDRNEIRASNFDESVTSNAEEVGVGYSGIIRLCESGGEKLIVKSWNKEEHSGLEELQNEINVYKILSEKKYNVQGRAMPLLKGSFNESSPSAMVVMEHVGIQIREDEDGSLVVGDDMNHRTLAASEAKALRKAAVDSLRSIHSTGYVHGDIALRNLRVVCENGAEATRSKSWRACWIDYGRANSVIASHFNKAFEIEMCTSLFAEAENKA